jgi:GntR family carbon starvation induced transcriptional regulator
MQNPPVSSLHGYGGELAPETLTESVRAALRRDVLSLAFAPGSHLSVRQLRERYEVGATPVREALWSLVGEGLIIAQPQHGFRVVDAQRERLLDLMRLRQRLEPWLLAQAMRQAGAEWRQRVEKSFAAFAPADAKIGDRRPIDGQWEMLHRRFHVSLVEGSAMPSLAQTIAACYEETDRFRRLASPDLGATAGAKGDHEELFCLIMAGESEAAIALLNRHISDTTERHLSYFESASRVPN